jgi:hypothetical protein
MTSMRVPRSGSMILTMLTALAAIFMLPVVFLGALSHSADARPQSMRETVSTLAQPIAGAVERVVTYARRHL